jgi:hypothetical protein
MTDPDITTLFGPRDPDQRTEDERAAYAKGYHDYRKHAAETVPSIVKPAFDPPPGCEPAYQAGWDQALSDEDDERQRAAVFLS